MSVARKRRKAAQWARYFNRYDYVNDGYVRVGGKSAQRSLFWTYAAGYGRSWRMIRGQAKR